MSTSVLAHRIYPSPAGTNYYAEDLRTPEQVEILFDYCQILEAAIFKAGWEHLVAAFGYDQLFAINRKSAWYDCEDINEFISIVEHEMKMIT